MIATIFTNVDALGGWSAAEVALLFGLSGVSFGLGDLLISPVENASIHIKAGTFDQFLIRPVGTLWQLCAVEFALRRLGRTIQPLIVLVIALDLVDLERPWLAAIAVPVTIVAGAVIFGAVWVVTSSVAFWTVETQEFANAFTYGGGADDQLPDRRVRPVAASARDLRRARSPSSPTCRPRGCSDKPMPFDLPDAVAWSSPLVAVASALVARAVWGTAPSATTGARGADMQRIRAHRAARTSSKTFTVYEQAGRVRRRKREVRAVDGIDLRIERRRRWSATSARTAPGSRRPSRC